MLARVALVCLLATTVPALAGPAVEIHASCAANVVADAHHLETLRSELKAALAQVSRAHVIDASLVAFEAHASGNDLLIHVEVRAIVSDADNHAQWLTSSKVTASGSARDRALVERDAISAAAREIGKKIATR